MRRLVELLKNGSSFFGIGRRRERMPTIQYLGVAGKSRRRIGYSGQTFTLMFPWPHRKDGVREFPIKGRKEVIRFRRGSGVAPTIVIEIVNHRGQVLKVAQLGRTGFMEETGSGASL